MKFYALRVSKVGLKMCKHPNVNRPAIPAIITFHSTYHCTGYEPANLFQKILFDSSSGCGIPEGSNCPSQSYPFSSF
jgi:hypothetical protein